ncbi:MAG: hypothetical protein WCR48_01490 [Bacteroidales bacterium]
MVSTKELCVSGNLAKAIDVEFGTLRKAIKREVTDSTVETVTKWRRRT